MSGGSSKPKQQVVEYRRSLHYGLAAGRVNVLRKLFVGDKVAWQGEVRGEAQFDVRNEGLFGGIKKEGGVSGRVFFQPGSAVQKVAAAVAAKYGRTPDTMTGYRGIATLFMGDPSPTKNTDAGKRAGFYWGANNPYVPPTAAELTRLPDSWYPEKAAIPQQGSESSLWQSISLLPKTHVGADDALGYAAGLTVSGISPGEPLVINVPPQTYGAWGLQGSGRWITQFKVAVDGNYANPKVFGVRNPESATAADAYALLAPTLPFTLAGGSSYTFYFVDNPTFDNVGQMDLTLSALGAGLDANPAHIIRECLTNRDWGMGGSTALIDDANFRTVADLFYTEGLGLSLAWFQQAKIGEFIQEILDHTETTLFIDPSTGLFTLKPIRGDYDPLTLPVLNPSNARLTKHRRQSQAEVVNELSVTWTNPVNEQEETIIGQSLGAIQAANGEVRNDTRKYYGARTRWLATRLLERDLRAASTPLATGEVMVNRKAWNFKPGQVFRLDWPDDGVNDVVYRVISIDYGKPKDPSIALNVIEDVFGKTQPELSVPPGTSVEDQSNPPEDPDYVDIFTLPYFIAANFVDPSALAGVDYPGVFIGVLAGTDLPDAQDFELVGEVTDFAGNVSFQGLGTRSLSAYGVLPSALAWEPASAVPDFPGLSAVAVGPAAGGLMIVGGGDAGAREVCLITEFDGANWQLKRGVLDTVPRAWPAGTPIWFIDPSSLIADDVVRSDGEVVDYKLLLTTTQGQLDEAVATIYSHTATERPYQPLRPANVSVGGTTFGVHDKTGDANPLTVTWSNRNRLLEDAQVLAWTAAGVSPETGQTTRIKVLNEVDAIVDDITGLAGETHDVPHASFTGISVATVEASSQRDGFDSLQAHRVDVIVSVGYGEGYGYNYGGG